MSRRWYPPQTVARLNARIMDRFRRQHRGRMWIALPRKSDGLIVGVAVQSHKLDT